MSDSCGFWGSLLAYDMAIKPKVVDVNCTTCPIVVGREDGFSAPGRNYDL